MRFCGNSVAYCTLGWTLSLLSWVVVVPAAIYRFYQLYQRRHVQLLWVRKLHFEMIYLFPMLLAYCGVTCPLLFLSGVTGSFGYIHVWRLINSLMTLIIISAVSIKVFVVHIDLSFAALHKRLVWKRLLLNTDDWEHDEEQHEQVQLGSDNEEETVNHHQKEDVESPQAQILRSRYIVWKTTWLDTSRLLCMSLIYQITGISITIALFASGTSLWSPFNAFWMIIEVISLVILWFYTPSFVDSFKMRFEIKILGIIGLISGVVWISIYLIGTLVSGDSFNGSPIDQLLSTGTVWCTCVSCIFLFSEMRWRYLPESVKKWDSFTRNMVNREMEEFSRAISVDESVHASPVPRITTSFPAGHLSLSSRSSTDKMHMQTAHNEFRAQSASHSQLICQRLLMHDDTVSIFAEFLASEFSTENLIGLIEWYQFAMSMLSMVNSPDEQSFGFLSQIKVDKDVVPLSSINRVNSRGDYRSAWMHRFVLLCRRYVGDHAVYHLNLPYWLSESLQSTMEDCKVVRSKLTPDEELQFVEECANLAASTVKECISLCRDSFSRFAHDSLFRKFQKVKFAGSMENPATIATMSSSPPSIRVSFVPLSSNSITGLTARVSSLRSPRGANEETHFKE